jgi:hypothetical protein
MQAAASFAGPVIEGRRLQSRFWLAAVAHN